MRKAGALTLARLLHASDKRTLVELQGLELHADRPLYYSADPGVQLDERRAAALSELRLFRDSLASLQARIPNLEHFIANSGPGEGEDGDEMSYLSSFGNPVTKLSAREEGAGPSRVRQRAEEEGNAEPERKKIKEQSPSVEPEEGDTEAVETVISLEFAVRSASFCIISCEG